MTEQDRIADLLEVLKLNRASLIRDLANHYRDDGVADRELLLSLNICQNAIAAIQQDQLIS